ncbi:MAG: phosphoadenosine phosphosulfate reductase [Acidobacteriota bacterium]|nr:phosphoadenosine phosphosulfate reductase [Acidobacteriota bacterium]
MSVSAPAFTYEKTDAELKLISDEFETAPPEAVLRWAVEEFGPDVALATGFGAEGCVLVAMLSTISPGTRIFYLDTDLLFPETYALRDQLEARYGVRFERRTTRLSLSEQAIEHGEQLWQRQPDLCCRLRKVEPLKEMLGGLRAWVTAIRRDQSPARASVGIVERDAKFGLIKINPLAAWSSRDVWNYIAKYDVPYNPLHNHGYSSIGCAPCTTPVQIGEDPRTGRWRGTSKTECGLHQ